MLSSSRALCLVLLATAPAAAEPHPSLDDFYDRTRDRAEGFDHCLGYCDERYLAGVLVGAETATSGALASGGRLGVDLGVRSGYADLARTKLWLDLLRVHETGDWLADLAWHGTAFRAIGEPGQPGAHLSFDSLVARRTELEPSDFAELASTPCTTVDTEVEVAATGGKVDKDAFLTVPIGVANRLRWPDGGGLERRTAVSAALAFRGFPKGIGHHDQLDVLRVKRTDWGVAGGRASSWTVSAGYQRLSPDIDWLQIWLLGGYERGHAEAGDRHGPVLQLGAQITLGDVELGPRLEEHLELDPMTARFTRIFAATLYARHRAGPVRWGADYEGISRDDGSLQALSPAFGVEVYGLAFGLRYRLVRTANTMAVPADRLQLTVDRRF